MKKKLEITARCLGEEVKLLREQGLTFAQIAIELQVYFSLFSYKASVILLNCLRKSIRNNFVIFRN